LNIKTELSLKSTPKIITSRTTDNRSTGKNKEKLRSKSPERELEVIMRPPPPSSIPSSRSKSVQPIRP